jgi:hypothetical protein
MRPEHGMRRVMRTGNESLAIIAVQGGGEGGFGER